MNLKQRLALCASVALLTATCLFAGAGAAPAPTGTSKPIGRIDFRDITVGDALRLLADQSQLNVVASERAAGIRTALFLRDVQPMDVLDALARTYNLWYQKDPRSGIVRVYTVEEFRLGQVDAASAQTEVFTLRYPNSLQVAYAISDLFGTRVRLSLGTNRGEDIIDELEDRFERFDIVNSRSQGLGEFGSSRSTGGVTTQVGRALQGRLRDSSRGGRNGLRRGAGRADPRFATGHELNQSFLTGSELESADRLIAGDAGETAAQMGRVLRQLSPIFVTVIQAQNRVLVRTRDPEAMRQIRGLVKELDTGIATLMLEVKVLVVDLDDQFDSVFQFSLTSGDLAVTSLPGARDIDSTLLATIVSEKFNARLQLLEREGRVTEVATPMLLTTNQEVSRIFVGDEIPITTGYTSSSDLAAASGDVNVVGQPTQPILVPVTEVRPVGTTLLLTPNINDDRTVTVRILVEQSDTGTTATIPVPVTNGLGGTDIQEAEVDVVSSRTFSGTVVTQDNITVAVGGLIEDTVTDRVEKVPVLGDVPLMGGLFRDTNRERSRQELILLITPHVMMTPTDSAAVSQQFLRRESVHPRAASPTGPLGVYRNTGQGNQGYELQEDFKLYDSPVGHASPAPGTGGSESSGEGDSPDSWRWLEAE